MQFPNSNATGPLVKSPARLLLIVLLACTLSSCGQKGPLQRPDQTSLAVTADMTSVS